MRRWVRVWKALGISTDFCPSVLAARQLEGGIRFGLGSTLAFRRAELEKIGGFTSFVDYLADDYELGKRIAGLGLTVKLSDVVVETYLPSYRLREFFAHQLRWARGVRDARAGGYLGLVFTFGFLWSLLALAASRGALWAWGALAVTLFLRFAVALVVGRGVLQDRQILKYAWLIPLRDLVAAVIWIVSLGGHTVTWRGDRFQLKMASSLGSHRSAVGMRNRIGCHGNGIAAVIENRPDFAGQLFQRERLLQKIVFDIDHFMVQHGLAGIARDE